MSSIQVWVNAFACGRRVFVAEHVCAKCPVWCEACARAYSEPCHRCAPCALCLERRVPNAIARALIVRTDAELNHELEAYRLSLERQRGKRVPFAEMARDLLWRGLNEARRWRHPPGDKREENSAQGKLFE
jgi:hypothetical protein